MEADDKTERYAPMTPGVRRLLACAVVVCACNGKATDKGRPVVVSTMDSLFAALTIKLAPLNASIDSMRVTLRRDSASLKADSTLMQFRSRLDSLVRTVSSSFDRPTMQRLVCPSADSLTKFFDAHGVWAFCAEGDAYFQPSEDRLSEALSPYVTEPTREYLHIVRLEQRVPTGGDAAVTIPWDSLAARLWTTDHLIATYSDAVVRPLAEQLRMRYVIAYLTGWENTSVFRGREETLEVPVRQSYERYVAQHASTQTGQVVQQYLQMLRRTGYQRNASVKAFVARALALPGARDVR